MSRAAQVELVDYSEKALAIFGNTKAYRDAITAIGGKFNPSLKKGDDRDAGWVFPKAKKAVVEKLVNDINAGKVSQSAQVESDDSKAGASKYSQRTPTLSAGVDQRAFLALVSRVEQLEQELALTKKALHLPVVEKRAGGTTSSSSSSTISYDDGDADEEAVEEVPVPRLLKKKLKQ